MVKGEGGISRWCTEDFQDSETILYAIIMMDTCHNTFGKTQKIHSTKKEDYHELLALGVNVYQCRL